MIRAISLFILLFIIGCGKNDIRFFRIPDNYESSYFIYIKQTTDKDSAISVARQLEENFKENVFIETDSSLNEITYNIKFGKFISSYEAGELAYKQYGFEQPYKITRGKTVVPDHYKSIIFIGNSSGLPALFTYNLVDRKSKLLFRKEKVIKLEALDEKEAAFFLTANEIGRKGIFPYITGLKLYFYGATGDTISLLKNIGSCTQVFTFRETPDIFKIIFYKFDKQVSTYVIEKTIAYNHNGMIISEQSKTYDLVTENYPVPPEKPEDYISHDKKYILTDSLINTKNEIYLKEDDNYFLITSLPHSLAQIGWTDNGKYLVFTTSYLKDLYNSGFHQNVPKSGFFIYDLQQKRILEQWMGTGYKNFYLRGDFLFFNTGFSINSGIKIYNLKKKTLLDSITYKGGCSLFYMPSLKRES